MSRQFIAFYMGDYQKKTQHLTTEQHGAYFLLLQHCWIHGSIPADPGSRAAIARLSLSQWKKMAPIIDAFFNDDGTNPRASEEIEKAERKWAQRVIAGKKGGERSGVSRAINAGSKIEAKSKQTGSMDPSKNEANHEADNQAKLKPPRSNLEREDITSSFLTAARENKNPGGLLATALPTGALARRLSSGASLSNDELKELYPRKETA